MIVLFLVAAGGGVLREVVVLSDDGNAGVRWIMGGMNE
jgi:hypothetical protein